MQNIHKFLTGSLLTLAALSNFSAQAASVVIVDSTDTTLATCNLDNLAVNSTGVTIQVTDSNCVSSTPTDTTAPTISSRSPADNGSMTSTSANIVAYFSESIAAGTGDIALYNADTDSLVERFAISSGVGTAGGTVGISGSTLTINPNADLTNSTNYYVQIPATAIDDLSGNSFAGITSTTGWNFLVNTSANVIIADPNQYIPVSGGALPTTAANGMLPGVIYAMRFSNAVFDHNINLKLEQTFVSGYVDAYVDVFLSYTPGVQGEVAGAGCTYSDIQNKTVYIYSNYGLDDCDLNDSTGTYYVNVALSSNTANNHCGDTARCTISAKAFGL